jgi:sugar O-acyltransferase (sialic acid O-acetyltransferase NeuD family)
VQDKVAIIGYSGHGFVVADAAITVGIRLAYYCEKSIVDNNPFNLEYLGFEGDTDFIGWKENFQYILGIGDNALRSKIASRILSYKKQLPNIIHPSTSISNYLKIGVGNFISRQVSINAFAHIGNYCILNTGCIIEHECKIGDGVHVAPGAVLAGSVEVGELSFIGANSVIKQGIKIGSNVTIGSGAVILKDVIDNQTIVGNPGRII